jgi:hypothetical protein
MQHASSSCSHQQQRSNHQHSNILLQLGLHLMRLAFMGLGGCAGLTSAAMTALYNSHYSHGKLPIAK